MQSAEEIKGPGKSPQAFRTISEASSELGVPQHVLRFWETKFSFIRPMKRAGGRRFYRRQDIAVLKGVRALLHEGGYTIKGVQRLHKEQGTRLLVGAGEGEIPPPAASLREAAATIVQDHGGARAGEPLESAPAPSHAPPAPPVSETAIVKADARTRLDAVLRDIEQTKAAIDKLLLARSD